MIGIEEKLGWWFKMVLMIFDVRRGGEFGGRSWCVMLNKLFWIYVGCESF